MKQDLVRVHVEVIRIDRRNQPTAASGSVNQDPFVVFITSCVIGLAGPVRSLNSLNSIDNGQIIA